MAKRDLIRNIILLIIGILGFIALKIWVFEIHQVKGTEANHFLEQGQRVLVMKTQKPKYGDFVLYQVNGEEHIGRVVAKAGDAVTFMDDVFYLNNQTKSEDYLASAREKYLASPQNIGYFTHDFTLSSLPQASSDRVLKNHYLILNDNRQDTKDSREYGVIAKKQVRGVIDFRLTPLDKFGFIENK